MKTRLGRISWATGTLLLVAVTGCGNDESDPPPSPSATSLTPTSSSSTPTTSASPTSPSDAAAADATQAMRDYFAVLDELRTNPTGNLKRLKTVATSVQLSALETFLRGQYEKGQRQIGTTMLSDLTVQSVNLDNSDPEAGKVPTVVIDLCVDVSEVDVLDKTGKSVVRPDRPDTGWTRYTVANYKYAADPSGGWRVAAGQDLKKMPCTAS